MNQIHGGDIYTYENVLDFSANINPLGPPGSVITALRESAAKICCYPDPQSRVLKQGISRKEGVPPEWIICGNGAADLIYLLVQTRAPKKALVLSPTFAEYEQSLISAGCEVIFHDLEREKGFTTDRQLLDKLTTDLDLFFLCNPNNPVGNLTEPGLLDEVIERCRKNQIFLVIDECFLDFLEDEDCYTRKKDLAENDNLMILKAFTKLYAMPGIRLGYALCSSADLLCDMESHGQPWRISVPAQEAGSAALTEEVYVRESRILIDRERERLVAELGRMGLKVYPGHANYLFFEGPAILWEECLKQKILLRDCSNYRGLRTGDYRIAVRTIEENDRLLACLREICGRGRE